jgi:ATP adenylyltransferase
MIKAKDDKKNFIVIRKKHAFTVLNIFPYNNGHVLVVPNREVADLSQLNDEEKKCLFDLMEETKDLLKKTLKPKGFNIGLNLGRVAGAGIPEHLHIHIVPRWWGDSNFMPVVADTKVISQSLKELYEVLTRAYKTRLRKTRK